MTELKRQIDNGEIARVDKLARLVHIDGLLRQSDGLGFERDIGGIVGGLLPLS